MGQKINPNIFRLGNKENWNSRYVEKKSNEFCLYQTKDFQIKKFIIKFFKTHNLSIHSLKLNYLNNNLNILVVYAQNFNSTLLISDINKNQKIKLSKIKFLQKKRKKKVYRLIVKTIKKFYNYEILIKKKKNKILKKKILLKKRIKIFNYFKKYLNLKKNKNIKNVFSNIFLNKFFESLILFFKNTMSISLILQPLLKTTRIFLKKKQQIFLKNQLIKLKNYKKNDFFKDSVNIIFSTVNNSNSAGLLSKYIALTLSKLKKHNFFIKFVEIAIKIFMEKNFYSKIEGIKIKIKGRINGSARAREKTIQVGQNMPILTLNAPIDYVEDTVYTSNGTLGVKIWVNKKSIKNNNVKRTETNKI